jgi:hypothetical protein
MQHAIHALLAFALGVACIASQAAGVRSLEAVVSKYSIDTAYAAWR